MNKIDSEYRKFKRHIEEISEIFNDIYKEELNQNDRNIAFGVLVGRIQSLESKIRRAYHRERRSNLLIRSQQKGQK